MVKEMLSVARAQSRVGGSFFMDIRKTEWSVEEGGLQAVRSHDKQINGKQKNKTAEFNFM
jgi:hypothetical protein